MIDPPLDFLISGIAACAPRKTSLAFTFITWSRYPSVWDSIIMRSPAA